MTKDKFVAQLRDAVNAFDASWTKGHKKDPAGYPLEMNEGDWLEQFEAHMEQEGIEGEE